MFMTKMGEANPMSTPKKQGLSDAELTDIITKIIKCEYDEAEIDYQLQVLECETGLINISDYIFYPDEVGLAFNAGITEIVSKILSDKNTNFAICL
ncbi:MAG: hypothetical protein II233_05365 [Clostridia bacterium]|nr:hypothetical protein [Clostridia bacterium]MEE1124984.1 hypothetical protein [Acutalibacteraceae bacterium]